MKHLIFAAVALTMGHAALACTCGTGTHQVGDVCVADASNKGSKSNATSDQSQAQTQSSASRSNATGGNVGAVGSSSISGGGAATVGNVAGGAAAGGSSNAVGGAGGQSSSSATGGSGTGGDAQSGASSNAQSTTYSAPRAPVNTALAGFQQTTAGCRFAEGLGVQLTSAGTSVGFTFKDHDCVRFELAQFFYSRGQAIAGDRVICAVHEVRQVLGEDCEALVHQIVATVPADAVTHAEMRAGLKALNQQKETGK